MFCELLEQSRWNLHGITASPYRWPGQMLEVKGQSYSKPWGGKGIHVHAGASKSVCLLSACRRTESTPRSGWWRSHMAGIYSDCSTREMKMLVVSYSALRGRYTRLDVRLSYHLSIEDAWLLLHDCFVTCDLMMMMIWRTMTMMMTPARCRWWSLTERSSTSIIPSWWLCLLPARLLSLDTRRSEVSCLSSQCCSLLPGLRYRV